MSIIVNFASLYAFWRKKKFETINNISIIEKYM